MNTHSSDRYFKQKLERYLRVLILILKIVRLLLLILLLL